MSTQIRFGLVVLLCVGAFSMGIPAGANEPSDPADVLPRAALKDSSSGYLRDAAGSAVQWQPWSDATFALAHKLNRPTLIDVGAGWCHWCHVMDNTTYADPEVAATINRLYVPIKVDMDERPDVDARYQDAAAHLTGAGGWPLTCFATPDGTLLYVTGYLPPKGHEGESVSSAMLPLLERIAFAYQKDPAGVQKQAAAIAKKIASEGKLSRAGGGSLDTLRKNLIVALSASYDRKAGGFRTGAGPRFYDFPAIRLALAYGFFQHDEYREMALESLDKISRGGVFDQLGGGFHRYSTDPGWRVPHFEKMAADQAMALSAYSEAYEYTRASDLLTTIAAIRNYVNQTLLDPATRAFFADQDADSFKGDDGSYYTWTVAEVKSAMPPDVAQAAIEYYGMAADPAVAPDGRIVPRRPLTDREMARKLGLTEAAAKALQSRARRPMMAVRDQRPAPPVDHAIMTDRNALMIIGYLKASDATGDRISRQAALAALDFILANLRDPRGGFYHAWSDGHASVAGIAADQVYLLDAILEAYQASGEDKYLRRARALADLIAARYIATDGLVANRGGSGGMQALYDSPMPSVQAEAAHGFRILGGLTEESRYTRTADELLGHGTAFAGGFADASLGALGLALEEHADRNTTVAIVGDPKDPRTQSLAETALGTFRPGKIVMRVSPAQAKQSAMPAPIRAMYAAASDRNAPLAFVCSGTACSKPSATTEELRHALNAFQVAEIAQTTAIDAPSSQRAGK